MFEYLIEKINEVQSYDDIVVLGTLGVLMHTKNILSNKEVVNEIQIEIDKLKEEGIKPASNKPVDPIGEQGTGEQGTGEQGTGQQGNVEQGNVEQGIGQGEGNEPGTNKPVEQGISEQGISEQGIGQSEGSGEPVGQTGEEGTGEEGLQEKEEYPEWDDNSETSKMLESVMTDLRDENPNLNDIQQKLDQLKSQNKNQKLGEILDKLTTLVKEKQSAKEFGHELEKQKKTGGADTFDRAKIENILKDGDYNIFTDVVKQFFRDDLSDIPATTFHFTKFDIPFDGNNWQQDFVNLAQVFYETEFCPDTFTGINDEEDLNDELGLFVMEVNDVLKNRTDIKKSVSLVYYKKKLLLSEEKKYSNLRNVEFKYFNDEKKLKKNIKIPREKDRIKQQIVVLDEPTFTGVQEIVDKSNVDTVIIVVGGDDPKLTDNDKEHIRWIRVEASQLSFENNRVTYSGCADKEYFFEGNYDDTVRTASIENAILQNLVLCVFDVRHEGLDTGLDEEGPDVKRLDLSNVSGSEGSNKQGSEGSNAQ